MRIGRNANSVRSYRWFLVAALTGAYILSFIDRQILAIFVSDVKRDLHLSDTRMGLLIGLSFAIFYTGFGLMSGILVDRFKRPRLVALGILIWSFGTFWAGLATNFTQLFLCRMGVGLGESILSPAAYAMLADYFPTNKRGVAFGIYGCGIYTGTGLAYATGDIFHRVSRFHIPLVGVTSPWQACLIIIGTLGILYSIIFLFLHEAPRPLRITNGIQSQPPSRIGKTVSIALIFHYLGFALFAMAFYVWTAWTPVFLHRVRGMALGDIGFYLGTVVSLSGTLGVIAAGSLADRIDRRHAKHGKIVVARVVAILLVIFSALYLWPSGRGLMTVSLSISMLLLAAPFGVGPALIQDLVPSNLRGRMSALYLFVNSLLGLGLGPTSVGILNDHVFRSTIGIQYSMFVVLTSASILALIFITLTARQLNSLLGRATLTTTPT